MILHAFICVLALLILAGGLKALAAFFNAARRRATALAPISTSPPPPRFFGFPSLINIVGVALFLAAGFILSSEALAQEQVTVHYQQIPANGIGGTLTALGLESGETVEKGARVTFVATPAPYFYVWRWNHADCAETGDIENPGGEKICALTVNSELSVAVTLADSVGISWSCNFLSHANPILSCAGRCWTPERVYSYTNDEAQPPHTFPEPYRCPNSHIHMECDDWARCLYDGISSIAKCAERGFPPPPECHNRGERECAVEAQEVTGAACVPPPSVSVVYNGPQEAFTNWPFSPPDDFRHGVELTYNETENLVVVGWAIPFNFNGAVVSGYEILRETNGSGKFVSVGFEPGHIRVSHVDLRPPSGATVRYMISMRSDPGPGPVSKISRPRTIPLLDVEYRDCAAENRHRTLDPQACGECFAEHELLGGFGLGDGSCIPLKGGFGGLSQEVLCSAFGGVVQEEEDGKICSAIDQTGTFCILDSKDAFPCRGLFKTVRTCNLVHKRPALNPFACAAKCPSANDIVVGDECRRNMITPP